MSHRPILLLSLLSACTSPQDVGSDTTRELNRTHARVDSAGLTVEAATATLRLGTVAWGREGSLVEAGPAAPGDGACWEGPPSPRLRKLGCEPTVARPLPAGVELWRPAGAGAAQAWILDEAPPGDGPVVIEVEVAGADLVEDAASVLLVTEAGEQWTYTGLQAWDAGGRTLATAMSVEGSRIRVSVDDRDASWPITVDPLLTPAATVLTEPSVDFGLDVAAGGDVNNDGYPDVIVGARFGVDLYGQAFSYHGGPAGLSTTATTMWSSPVYYGKFGEYVDNRGDVNGDGYADAVISTFYADTLEVFHGSAGGLGATAATSLTGPSSFGRDLALIGDWNGDGYDDLVVGSSFEAGYYRGSAAGLVPTPVASQATAGPPAVSSAGDVNSDGYDDVVVGDVAANTAYVALGAATFPGATATLAPAGAVSFGLSVSGGGDVNGDGYDEVIVSDPGNELVHVYYGSAAGVSATNVADLAAPIASSSGFGTYLGLAGDVNGDGYDDLVASDTVGNVWLFHGSAGGLVGTPAVTLAITLVTNALSGADIDQDGFSDLVLGSWNVVYVFRGCADADADGECAPIDCDDADSARHSGAAEVCDTIDNDCDGLIDDADTDVGLETVFYADADGDGFGNPLATAAACAAPPGYVADATDCDDGASAIHPGATETEGDGVDADCDGGELCFLDADGDGYRTDATVASPDPACDAAGEALATLPAGDCDDADPAYAPNAVEVCGGGDEDCDGAVDIGAVDASTWLPDADGDGYTAAGPAVEACAAPPGHAAESASPDCDDSDSGRSPGAPEVPDDGIDQDCDGQDAEGATVPKDTDPGKCGCASGGAGIRAGWPGVLALLLVRRRARPQPTRPVVRAPAQSGRRRG